MFLRFLLSASLDVPKGLTTREHPQVGSTTFYAEETESDDEEPNISSASSPFIPSTTPPSMSSVNLQVFRRLNLYNGGRPKEVFVPRRVHRQLDTTTSDDHHSIVCAMHALPCMLHILDYS